jgi:hypothetical protein
MEYLDVDGYPTEEALDKIAKWSYNDPKGWFEFIKEIWWMRDWGWHENKSDKGVEYNISTGGWSGSESLIRAMMDNHILWTCTWVQSRKGGHYIFEVNDYS